MNNPEAFKAIVDLVK